MLDQGKLAGHYVSTKRVTFGATDAQNTAMLTMTILFLGNPAPENITAQGSHDFSSGKQVGSVSAASSAYARYIGHQFARVGDSVNLG